MNFEAKHLIRWGIPGWLFIFWIFYGIVFLKGINPLNTNLLEITEGFTLLISLAVMGVPIGYLMHQIYFGIAWVLNKNRDFNKMADKIGENFPKHEEWDDNTNEKYFQIEYIWHTFLIKQKKEERDYIEGRYRHLLGTTHGIGSLFVSSIMSLTGTIIIIMTTTSEPADFLFNLYLVIGMGFQAIILLFSIFNFFIIRIT